jgi:hypothetical protein
MSRKIAGFGFFKDDWHQFPHLGVLGVNRQNFRMTINPGALA